MPIPLLALAGISAGANVLGNVLTTGMQNKANMDNWLMQQDYNSPKNQMARFKEAGLNPNLIYGTGTAGNATSAPVSQAPDLSPKLNLADLYMRSAELNAKLEMQKQTIENMKTNQELLTQTAQLRQLQGDDINSKIASRDMLAPISAENINSTINARNSLLPYQVDMAKANIKATQARTEYQLDENERRARLTTSNIAQANQKIKNMREERELTVQRTLQQMLDNDAQVIRNANLATQINQAIAESQARVKLLNQNIFTSQTSANLNNATIKLREAQRNSTEVKMYRDAAKDGLDLLRQTIGTKGYKVPVLK